METKEWPRPASSWLLTLVNERVRMADGYVDSLVLGRNGEHVEDEDVAHVVTWWVRMRHTWTLLEFVAVCHCVWQ